MNDAKKNARDMPTSEPPTIKPSAAEQSVTNATSASYIDYCGEQYPLGIGSDVTIGRDGDIVIDDNPYLHRHFLRVECADDIWWLHNVGSQLSATVGEPSGGLQAWLKPGASIPLVFAQTTVWFTAGSTTYDFDIYHPAAAFSTATPTGPAPLDGNTTVGAVDLTPTQRLLIVALAEDTLVRHTRGGGTIPSSSAAAERLGWTLTRFNRKLDNVCQKLTRVGVRGLHGGPEKLAVNRRARLVEYAISVQLVSADDLSLLP